MCRPARRGHSGCMIQTVITSIAILGIIVVGLLAVIPSVMEVSARQR